MHGWAFEVEFHNVLLSHCLTLKCSRVGRSLFQIHAIQRETKQGYDSVCLWGDGGEGIQVLCSGTLLPRMKPRMEQPKPCMGQWRLD